MVTLKQKNKNKGRRYLIKDYDRCLDCKLCGYFDMTCKDVLICKYRDRLEFKDRKKANVTINKFTDYTELVEHKKMFAIFNQSKVRKVDRQRKFISEGGVLKSKNGDIKIDDLQYSLLKSSKRAKDNFYGYALCNDWRYFVTLTFDPKKVDRDNEEQLKYVWKIFRQKLQYIEKNVKILCVPERHPKSGKIHFHCILGDIDLTKYCIRAVNAKTNKPMFSKFGDTIYNLSLWDYGFSTLVDLLEHGYDKSRVANYLIDYCTKENDIIGYNKKRYYCTKNLQFKEKHTTYLTSSELDSMINDIQCVPHKETSKMKVYKIFHVLDNL